MGKDAIAQPRAEIQNRADLIQALTVASQLEHGLMLMYLYAAFSMKSFPEELSQYPDPEVLRNKLRNWEASILRVARQEMEHLGFVCNMLSAIGGNQYFDRPQFPAAQAVLARETADSARKIQCFLAVAVPCLRKAPKPEGS
jgi:rubrerythrin